MTKIIFSNTTFAAVAVLLATAAAPTVAIAQERPLTISPGEAIPPEEATGAAPNVFTDDEGTWERVSLHDLHASAPLFAETSEFHMGRGTQIPNDVDTALMRNVSIHGLRHGMYYNYFSSPDSVTVIINPHTRRVVRMIPVGY